jgi:hypothetical protein
MRGYENGSKALISATTATARLRAHRHCAEDVSSRGHDSEFREQLRCLGAERRRFVYRRLRILLSDAMAKAEPTKSCSRFLDLPVGAVDGSSYRSSTFGIASALQPNHWLS